MSGGKPITPRQLARAVPVMQAMRSSVVAKRRANNDRKSKGRGLKAQVADNDPMAKDSESNWP
jgi:hypothetical protein